MCIHERRDKDTCRIHTDSKTHTYRQQRRSVQMHARSKYQYLKMSICQNVYLFKMSICQNIYKSKCISVKTSICQSFYILEYFSVKISTGQSVYLSKCLYVKISTCQNAFLSKCKMSELWDAYICVLAMGWLRLVGSLKFQVSFAKELYKRDLYSAKESYHFKEPTHRSHLIFQSKNTYILARNNTRQTSLWQWLCWCLSCLCSCSMRQCWCYDE